MPLYSYSRIGCFENCPRQYKFRYIEKPPIDKPEGIEAFMGKMAHEALEKCYQLVTAGRPPSREDLVASYRHLWQEKRPNNLKIVREQMTEDDYFGMGLRALESYHDRFYPFDQEMTLGLERRVVFSLDPEGRYKMQGYIDRLTRDKQGRLRIQDYKTGGSLPTQQDVDGEAQLALYQIAVDEMWPDNTGIELVWHYLQFHEVMTSRRTPEQLAALRTDYIAKIRRIEKATELGNFPTNETSLCNWCDYAAVCPVKGGAAAAGQQQELTLTPIADPAPLVDEFVTLTAEKRRLGKRLDELKEAFTDLAQGEGDRVFTGAPGNAVQVSLGTSEKLPTKAADPPAFEQITEAIRGAGLFDEFAVVDLRAVQKAFDACNLPEPLQQHLQALVRRQPTSSVKVKKV